MATRKVYLTVENGGYTTNGEGEWIDLSRRSILVLEVVIQGL